MSTTAERRATPVEPITEGRRTAVVLNANAKRVTQRVRREVESAAPHADVFYTRSLEEAAFVTRRIADNGYDFVFTGGGDGTVVNTIDQVCRRLDEIGAAYPRFGVLKLGTGNGIADFFGAGDYRNDLARAQQVGRRDLHLIELDGETRTPFCGFGWDALHPQQLRPLEAAGAAVRQSPACALQERRRLPDCGASARACPSSSSSARAGTSA
jgi:hypothetical protein